MWIFTVPMWPTVCVSVPAELSPRTLCHLQPGRESGSPHRSTHGWAPFANTVPAHPVTCRHVHMPALLIEMQNVVCVVLLCVMFHNPLFAIPLRFIQETDKNFVTPPLNSKLFYFAPPPRQSRLLPEKDQQKLLKQWRMWLCHLFSRNYTPTRFRNWQFSPVINWGLSVPHKSQHVHLSAPL